MKKHLLFIQGGGDGGYQADKSIVESLQLALGEEFMINYPPIYADDSLVDYGWTQQIKEKIAESKSDIRIVAHSFGASMLLKFLSENVTDKKMTGIYLLASPFWSGDEAWKQGLKLQENFADKLPNEVPIFLYHCQDDEEVPFLHLNIYRQKLTQATFRELKKGGHQFNTDLTLIAEDIKSL